MELKSGLIKIKIIKLSGGTNMADKTITLRELIEKSDIIEPPNLVRDKNNCLESWEKELQAASDKIKRQTSTM